MHAKKLQADVLLLLVAIIWGFAFVAQRLGLELLGPFGFNTLRFLLGALSLLPLLFFFKAPADHCHKRLFVSGLMAGAYFLPVPRFNKRGSFIPPQAMRVLLQAFILFLSHCLGCGSASKPI
tara:strand:+ start:2018 stop:2383 length:366 start_codon:yes stop_codon:yes gene_type:complete